MQPNRNLILASISAVFLFFLELMTKRQFVVLAFRLFALYLIINLVPHIDTMASGSGRRVTITEVVTICNYLYFIYLLWMKGEWLMEKVFAIPVLSDVSTEETQEADPMQPQMTAEIVPRNPDDEAPEIMDYYEAPISMESIEILLLCLVGLWTAFAAIPNVVREINDAIENPMFSYGLWISIRWHILPDFIQLALGIWLFLRPWQFQGWIEKFKPKGDLSEEGEKIA
jgi:hypothetical protein